ncbi:hypothetical protein [Streptomyces sp. B3I8]|uniref:hypothetical protein n=1 Tax=Streptomyces sp. B3I8 TaxID=3042303 RepID=UPI002780AB1F|nr:hypothetical protein [Streptomyces sp. B3I8]MDQ0789564.1 hypothetical protein [Streptomyces sp. B3I8]
MKYRLIFAALLVAGTTSCGMIGGGNGGGGEKKEKSNMNMQEAADRADALLADTMDAIKPPVDWVHGLSSDLSCSVSRRVAVTTVISNERRGSFLGIVERHWKKKGFTHRGSNNSKSSPATYFLTSDNFQIRLRFGYQGQAQFEVTTPCVEESEVSPPKPRAGAPEYDGSEPPPPDERSEFWSADSPVQGTS